MLDSALDPAPQPIPAARAAAFTDRFTSHRELRACLDAALEGRLGSLWSGGGAARADVGCYAFFGGDPRAPGARALVRSVTGPHELVWGSDPSWEALIRECWGSALVERTMRAFDPSGLTLAHLEALATQERPGYRIVPFDTALAEQLDDRLRPHALAVFTDPSTFVAQGLGRAAVAQGRLVGAATSYAIASGRIELAIATHADHRHRGVATGTAAALAADSLRRGLVPHWNAANALSERLATRLGYRRAGVVELLCLR